MSPLQTALQALPLLRDATASGNLSVLRSFLGPAYRGLVERRGVTSSGTGLTAQHQTYLDWTYLRDRPQLARLYDAAVRDQWSGSGYLPWATDVDPLSDERVVLPDDFLPVYGLPAYQKATVAERREHRRGIAAWLMSQFLHGEQGALFASCQVVEAVPWMDAKLYGSTQVVDEGRHVEVFHRYLTDKLQKRYTINDNLYLVIDALMSDARWDMKFLGMQILVEGLALGAFGMMRQKTQEPLLKALLTAVITDEARHVHYGVLALTEAVSQLSEKERQEREDWAFEVSLFLKNRFFAHEFYDEYYGQAMSRTEWEKTVLASPMMGLFRQTMFKRVIPNLKRIGLLSERVRPRYQELGVLDFEQGLAAPELSARDLLDS